MKKKIVSILSIILLVVSLPISALADNTSNNASVESLVKKGVFPKTVDYDAKVSVEDFINYALTALTYQHGSESLRAEIVDKWVLKGELENRKSAITSEELSRILIRALDLEDQEKSLEDYKKSAGKHGLFNGVTLSSDYITVKELATIIENFKKIEDKEIDNKGVKEISVEDFVKSPGSFGYQLSPDGNYLSYAAEWENRSNVFVKNMNDDNEPVRVTNSKDRDIGGFFWKNDRIFYVKDKGGDENYHIYSSTFSGAEEKDLTPYPNVTVSVLSQLKDAKDEILIMMNKENPTVFDVYKLNIKTGETTHVAKNPGNVTNWVADRDGKIRIAVQSDGVEGVILYRESEKEEFKPFIEMKAGDEVNPLYFSKDNQSIYALSNKGRDKVELVKFDLKGKEEVVFSNPTVDVMGAAYDSTRNQLLFGAYITDKLHYTFFDEKLKKLFTSIKEKLNVSESELGLEDYNKEMTKFIVSVSSDTVYGKYYYYDSTTDKMTELGSLSPWLEPNNMAEMHPISYKSRDGLTINGYLTLPKNKKLKTYR